MCHVATLAEIEQEPVVTFNPELSDSERPSDELVVLPDQENVIVSESEVPMTADEKLKHFECHFQDLIDDLMSYEARADEFRGRLFRIRGDMQLLYVERDKMESSIKELVDTIWLQRANATRVLGNRIVLREADVLETRKRTEAIQKTLDEKMEELKRLKRKIDAASNTDFRLREEIRNDLRKTNGLVATYMEEIEGLNKEKIIQLKSLKQDFCTLCLPNQGHNSDEEMSKISGAVAFLENSTYKHAFQRLITVYHDNSRDLNEEVGVLMGQKKSMCEKIECVESALDRLAIPQSPSSCLSELVKYELPPLKAFYSPITSPTSPVPVDDATQTVVQIEPDEPSKVSETSKATINTTSGKRKESEEKEPPTTKPKFSFSRRSIFKRVIKQDSLSREIREPELSPKDSISDISLRERSPPIFVPVVSYKCEMVQEASQEELSDIEPLSSPPTSPKGSNMYAIGPPLEDGAPTDRLLKVAPDDAQDTSSSPSSEASSKEILSVACFHWQLSITSSPRRKDHQHHRSNKGKNGPLMKSFLKPDDQGVVSDV